MKAANFFSILETASSKVKERNFFTTRSTVYIPDFFIVFFYLTIFCCSVFFEVIIIFFIFFNETKTTFGIVIALTSFLRVISEFFVQRIEATDYMPDFNEKFILMFNLVGFRSVLFSARILKEITNTEKGLNKTLYYNGSPIFHVSDENLSLIKIYCCVAVIVKSIPQLFILSTLLLAHPIAWTTAVVATINILLNIVLFSFTMAITFPIRKTPKIFTTSISLIFSAFNKFMATWCACCLNLAIFAIVFKSYRYYALTVYLYKCIIWLWPCWQVVRSQAIFLPRLYSIVYLFVITLLFGFIYIHPFEGEGKLYYYFFYLLSALSDLAVIYLFTEKNLDETTSYIILRIIMMGFLCVFGLLNFLHTYEEKERHLKIKSAEDGNKCKDKKKFNDSIKLENKQSRAKGKEEAELKEIDIMDKEKN